MRQCAWNSWLLHALQLFPVSEEKEASLGRQKQGKGVWELLQEDLHIWHPKGISHGETREVKTLIGEFCTSNEQIDGFCFSSRILSFPWERGICIAYTEFGRQLCWTNTLQYHFYLGSPCFPQTHAEAVHKDAMPPVKKTKVLIPFLNLKKKRKQYFHFHTSSKQQVRIRRC